MPSTTTNFAPELFRGQLLLLAKKQWGHVLQAWGEPSDVVQLTLLEAHNKLGTFKGETTPAFVDWLRRILLNNMLDVIRATRCGMRDYKKKTSLTILELSSAIFGVNLAYDDPSPSRLAIHEEELNSLADALERLLPDQREAITLHHLWGLTSKETAEMMGRSTQAVGGLLHRGLKALREQMRQGER